MMEAAVAGYNLSIRQAQLNPGAPKDSQVRDFYLRWTLSYLHVVPNKYRNKSYAYEK